MALRKTSISISTLARSNFEVIRRLVGDSEVVMIGEASHGTEEFYQMRADITRALIEHLGFNIVAVEADWPDAYRANRFVNGSAKCKDATAEEALSDFKRFPQWMWRNHVTKNFLTWMRTFNQDKAENERAGFYGLDLYSLYTSMELVLDYLASVDPQAAHQARQDYSILRMFQDPQEYAMALARGLVDSQKHNVVQTLIRMLKKGPSYLESQGGFVNGDELFFNTQNAALVVDAENYYRNMLEGGAATWNIRDTHMCDMLEKLMSHVQETRPGVKPRAIVWAHNSHLGDARAATGRGAGRRSQLNIGQLVRERFGLERTFSIGFSTHHGSVRAALSWGAEGRERKLNPGLADSYEGLLHQVASDREMESDDPNFALLLRSQETCSLKPDPGALEQLRTPRLERFVGVIYRADTELFSHYQKYNMVDQFDLMIHLDETRALQPI